MVLFPKPQSVSYFDETVPAVKKQIRFEFDPTSRLLNAAHILGYEKGSGESEIVVELDIKKGNGSRYELSLDRGTISIEANTEEGVYYALTTLNQIIQQQSGDLPTLKIEDWADLPIRGYMLDISRCKVPTMQSLFELIDLLSDLKYNQLQLYTEHTFAYASHEEVWKSASPLNAEEIRRIDTYCYDRYIELIPNQNSFGHMERWLRHDTYKHLAESPNGFMHPLSGWKEFGSTLKPTIESIDFVTSLYEEMLPNFRSKSFNIGGDEPWELGQGYSKKLAAKIGKRRIYVDHLIRIQNIVQQRGHKMQFWGDIIIDEPELVTELADNTIALLWGYEANHPFADQCKSMSKAGAKFYVVPGTSTWNTIGGRIDNAFKNIADAVRNSIEYNASGILLTEWGDNGHHQSHLISIPQIFLAAGLSWNFQGNKDSNLQETIKASDPNFDYSSVGQLGRITNLFKTHLHNGTWLNKIFFSQEKVMDTFVGDLAAEELNASIEALERISCKDELQLAQNLLLFAAHKGLAAIEQKELPALDPSLIDAYQTHWLARNRIGGLEESVNHIRRANQ